MSKRTDKVVIDKFVLEDTNSMLYSIVIDKATKEIIYSLDCSNLFKQLRVFAESGKKSDIVYLSNAQYFNTFCMLLHSVLHLKIVDLPSERVTGNRFFIVETLPDGIIDSFLDYDRLNKYLSKVGVHIDTADGSELCPLCDMHMRDLAVVLSKLPYSVKYCPWCGKPIG